MSSCCKFRARRRGAQPCVAVWLLMDPFFPLGGFHNSVAIQNQDGKRMSSRGDSFSSLDWDKANETRDTGMKRGVRGL